MRVLVALAMVGLLLAGCSDQPGSAAVVGDTAITENQVQDDAAEVIAAAETAGGLEVETALVTAEQVRRLVEAELVAELADRRGISVTAGEVDRSIEEVSAQVGGREALDAQLAAQAGVPPSALESFVITFLLKEALIADYGLADRGAAEAQLIADLGALSQEWGTEVSPRYGTWNPETVRVSERPGDLAAAAGASPPA
jgi:hypothetical protein